MLVVSTLWLRFKNNMTTAIKETIKTFTATWYLSLQQIFGRDNDGKINPYIYIPWPSKGCQLNSKGWCFSAPLIIHSAPFGRSRYTWLQNDMWSFPVGAHSPNLWSSKGPLGVFYLPMVWIQDASPKGRPGRSVLWLTYPRHLSQNQTLEQKNCSPENYTTWKVDGSTPISIGLSYPLTNRHLLGVAPSTFQMVYMVHLQILIKFQPLVCWGACSSQ